VQQGWEAAMAGKTIEQYAQDHLELKQAVEKFG
jgi:ribulose 1,5-bisphosphate carboxylase large subunit-like protein